MIERLGEPEDYKRGEIDTIRIRYSNLSRYDMPIAQGDILELLVTYVSLDACWGTSGDLTGFVHHTGWSKERPIPESAVPIAGQTLTVKVIHVVEHGEELPAWATFGGKFTIDFAAAVPTATT